MNCSKLVGRQDKWWLAVGNAGFPDDNFILTKAPTSYITIDYHDEDTGKRTGSLKIVVLNEKISTDRADTAIYADGGEVIKLKAGDWRGALYWTITQTNTKQFPTLWKWAVHMLSRHGRDGSPYGKGPAIWGCDSDSSKAVVRFARKFYDDLQAATPGLMAYRYQNQIFAQYTNSLDNLVTDYENPENTIIAKTVPVMDVTALKDTFQNSWNGGNFEAGRQFSYSHCIVDLDPTLSDYNTDPEARVEFQVKNGQFPMKFASGVNVNVDEYKTRKLVLQRIDTISGDKPDKFVMGSHSTDYDLITDPKKRKYKDDESIVDGAIDDHVEITLGNGGSYQRKRADLNLKDKETPLAGDDMYNYNKEAPDPSSDLRVIKRRDPELGKLVPDKFESRYFKNKHLFMDPFALTISQWCYIKLNSQTSKSATKETARTLLTNEGNLEEIERSYWRYICVWGEKGEWDYWKEQVANSRNVVSIDEDDIVEVDADDLRTRADNGSGAGDHTSTSDIGPVGTTPSDDDEEIINKLCEYKFYNPLDDTRPYYYATYNAIRGTGRVYKTISSGGNPYVMDVNKGDEYQMNSRNNDTLETLSFMDILNRKVVFQTQKRIYRNCDYDSRNTTPADRATAAQP